MWTKGGEPVEVGQDPSVGAQGDVEAVARAVFPYGDLSGVKDPPDPGVGAAALPTGEITHKVVGVVDGEIGAAPPGPDLSDGDDAAGDAQLLEPPVERRGGAAQSGVRTRRVLPSG